MTDSIVHQVRQASHAALDCFIQLARSGEIPDSIDPDRYSWPCVPYVGCRYEEAKRRILFVGKAPNGWTGDEEETPLSKFLQDGDANRALGLPTDFLRAGNCVRSHFAGTACEKLGTPMHRPHHFPAWRRIYELWSCICCDMSQAKAAGSDPARAAACFDSIAWANLFPIGMHCGGNPDSKMIRFLQFDARSAKPVLIPLYQQIEMIDPEIIMFYTGRSPLYDKSLRIALGTDVHIAEETLHRARVVLPGRQAWRTTHFRVLPPEEVNHLRHAVQSGLQMAR